MKDPRDERKWTNAALEADPQGYLAAQKARHEVEAAAADRKRAQQDAEIFASAFVANGGTTAAAQDAWRAKRTEDATEAAVLADEAARRLQRGATMGAL
jgi:hypothetical protein